MAGYVSSYPTLWSLSDMLSAREEGGREEQRKGKVWSLVCKCCRECIKVNIPNWIKGVLWGRPHTIGMQRVKRERERDGGPSLIFGFWSLTCNGDSLKEARELAEGVMKMKSILYLLCLYGNRRLLDEMASRGNAARCLNMREYRATKIELEFYFLKAWHCLAVWRADMFSHWQIPSSCNEDTFVLFCF